MAPPLQVAPGLTATTELHAAKQQQQNQEQQKQQQQTPDKPSQESGTSSTPQQEPETSPKPAPPPPASSSPSPEPPTRPAEARDEVETEEALYQLYDRIKVKPCTVAAIRRLYTRRDTPLRTKDSIIDGELERLYK
jgi:hypothetical protein